MGAYASTTGTEGPPPVVDPPPLDPSVFDPDPHRRWPGRDVAINEGARLVPDPATFETLARADDVPGRLGAEEMKILILGVDTDAPELYFLNTNAFAFHYDFAIDVLHVGLDLGEFNRRTYFRDDRSHLAATIIARDRRQPAGSSDAGLYALEFWPTDPVRAEHVALALHLVSQAMPFAAGKLVVKQARPWVD